MSEFEYWDRISRKRIELIKSGTLKHEVEWENEDPQALFAEFACNYAGDADSVLDIGCGNGEIGRCAAGHAEFVVSLDLSRAVITAAADFTEGSPVSFTLADVKALPFLSESFDLVCTRWQPSIGSAEALTEISRVMKPGATLLGLAIGELYHIETQELFGRGIHWPPARPVRFAIPEALEAAGLGMLSFAEYYGSVYYPSIDDFVQELETLPIIPNFDANSDAALLREVTRKLVTERGIRDTEHAAVFAAWKSD